MMTNLLQETVDFLSKFNKTLKDILYVTDGCNFKKVHEDDLRILLNEVYDNGYGCVEINPELKLVGKDFWLERYNYDGQEYWEFKKYPEYIKTNFETIMVLA